MAHDHSADSSGIPWEGREFQPNAHAGDDGITPESVAAAILAFRDGTGSLTELAAALAESRALIPLITRAGDDFDADNPVMEDKVQELAVVTLAGPNGEAVYPAFTSVEAMRAWNSDARPIPIELRRVCLAAAGEGADRVVINPGTDQIVLRRPVVWAIAQGNPYIAPWDSPEFVAATRALLADIDSVLDVSVGAGDPTATGAGPDVILLLGLIDGLDAEQVHSLTAAVHERVSSNELFVNLVDSLAVTLSKHGAKP
jgi:hypothetical protein